MRTAIALVVAASTLPFAASAGSVPGQSSLTVILKFEQPEYSALSLRSMKEEVAGILQDTGLQLDWLLQQDLTQSREFGDLVVFKLKGRCTMAPELLLGDELGLPFAITHTVDSEPLSFGEIQCDHVRRSILRARPFRGTEADVVFGRALGRVMAHEIYHMLTHSGEHARTGVTRHELSGRELCQDRLAMSEKSLAAIREHLALIRSNSAKVSGIATGPQLP